jgi:ABC-type glutathione transport system ATPase component
VTHRVVQAVHADLILVMDGGQIVERGRHQDLVAAGGLYQRLYDEASGTPADPREPTPAGIPPAPKERARQDPVLAAR